MARRQRRKAPREAAKAEAAAKKAAPATEPKASRPEPEKVSQREWLFAALLFVLGFAVYFPALNGPFVLDDYDLQEGFSTVRLPTLKTLVDSGRPLLMLTYIANHRMAGGFDPFIFHLTNILLHCLNALLLWRFAAALFAPGRFGVAVDRVRSLFVYGLPLLFLLSPIQTESVAYVSSRSEVLAGTFYIAGLWLFTMLRENRPWLNVLAVMICFVGAAASKQDKLTLPLAVILLDYLLLSQGWRGLKKTWPLYGLFGVGLVGGFFLLIRPFLFTLSAGFNLDWKAYFFTQLRMYFRYVGQLIWPFDLNLDPMIQPSTALSEHGSWLALVVLLLIAAACAYFHRKTPLPVFGALLFFLILGPTTSFYPLTDFAAERRLYLPAIGFFLVVLWGAATLAQAKPKAAYAALGAVALIYSGVTLQRALVWSDEILIWQDTVSKSPEKERPWTWLGRVYNTRGLHMEAAGAWMRANELVRKGSPQHAYLLNNLGLVHAQLGKYDEAIRYYRQAIELRPREGRFWGQLAVAQIHSGREEEGWVSFERAFQHRISPELLLLRAQEYFQVERYADAAADFEQALRFRPEDPEIQKNLETARHAAAAQGG